jgi:ribosomal protein S18 acetylase RimI-like enzyme
MSIKVIGKNEYPEHLEQLKITVGEIFPILGFTPEQIEVFIKEVEPLYDDTVYYLENALGKPAFSRTLVNAYGIRSIQYVIPSVWSDRYQIVKSAIEQIKNEFILANTEEKLFIRITEQVPSHNAYYAGLLPELGFDMEPRVTMTANPDVVNQLDLTKLPKNIDEISFSKNRLPEFIELYNRAYAVYQDRLLPERQAHETEFRQWQLTDAQEQEDAVKTWVGLEVNGEIIGSCYGRIWGNEMSVEELAILPEFYGKRLGRFLTIRCMQKLKEHFGEPSRYFFIGTNRTFTRALKLYHRLGFKINSVETYATLVNYEQ